MTLVNLLVLAIAREKRKQLLHQKGKSQPCDANKAGQIKERALSTKCRAPLQRSTTISRSLASNHSCLTQLCLDCLHTCTGKKDNLEAPSSNWFCTNHQELMQTGNDSCLQALAAVQDRALANCPTA